MNVDRSFLWYGLSSMMQWAECSSFEAMGGKFCKCTSATHPIPERWEHFNFPSSSLLSYYFQGEQG